MSEDNSKKHKNHYEILGLEKTCTEKDIRAAFVNLSKAHHPDLHPNDAIHKEKFIKIYEAYSVLSKPGSRVAYDSDLLWKEKMGMDQVRRRGFRGENDAPYYAAWRDESIWGMRDKTKENFDPNKPYYGIKGIKRVSNYWIAGGAVVLMLLGAMFHYATYQRRITSTIEHLVTRDERLARHIFVSRQDARRNGNDLQMRIMLEKMEAEDYRKYGGNPKE